MPLDMSDFFIVVLVSWSAGAAAFVGGVVAVLERSRESETKREVIHGVIAFGGGILLAAVAFALAPKGIAVLHPVVLALVFVCGGVVFSIFDARLARKGGSKAQFMAMLIDFVPEAISLGAVFGHDHTLGILLAAFIGAQNLPEGFNSYREFVAAGKERRKTLLTLAGITLLGPIAAAAGHLFLQGREQLTAAIMSFAGGGILYLIFQDVAPEAKLRRRWTPPLGAVLGFVLGMVGAQLIGV